jgi:subtilisin family serine protease/streptogramin lyase
MDQMLRSISLAFASVVVAMGITASTAGAVERDRYIVVFEDSVAQPADLARAQTAAPGRKLGFIYSQGLKGFSAELPARAAEALRQDPRVKAVRFDHRVVAAAQSVPTGISRTFATANQSLFIDEKNDLETDVDVAVIDTGIDYKHPDLNVAARTYCNGTSKSAACTNGTGTDESSHGTHVAGTIAALDNNFGVVGIAPGARLWSVKVLDPSAWESEIVAGVNWVTARADKIEVANMSIGCESLPCFLPSMEEAIALSVDVGVVYVVAAGNNAGNAGSSSFGYQGDVITVSALADFDGQPGEMAGASQCREEYEAKHGAQGDDALANFSNYGSSVEMAAPGACILSTEPGGTYGRKNGTSMASPHVAGAAAVLAALDNPDSQSDVEAIGKTLEEEGNSNWKDTSIDGITEPLLDVGDGTTFRIRGWRLQSTPAVPGTTGTWLEAISCSSASACTAVGFSEGTSGGPLAMRWNGSSWTNQSITKPSGSTSVELKAVSCPAANACTAVGSYTDSSNYRHTLAMRWNGTGWQKQSTPDPTGKGKLYPFLTGVSCVSSTSCTAVGHSVDQIAPGNESQMTLVMQWNGSNWNIQTSPNQGAQWNWLKGVSCTAAKTCRAVGFYLSAPNTYKPAVIHLDGGEWETKSTPLPEEGQLTYLYGISCTSASACAATGFHGNNASNLKTLAMRWDGTEWAVQATPNPEEANLNYLHGVSCFSSTSCTAVGEYRHESGPVRALAMRWDGAQWKIQATPRPESASESYVNLLGISCTDPTVCTAAGYYKNTSNAFVMLAERYLGDPPSAATSSASAVKGTEATLNGTANPNGSETTYQFEYGTTTSYGSKIPVSPKSIGSGASVVEVSQTPTGLSPNTTYHYRIAAENPAGTTYGGDKTLTTLKLPKATTEAASGVNLTEATLHGTVNPEGLSTTYQFEYGPTTSYGSKAPASPESVGSGTANVAVQQTLKGLEAGIIYHFRVVAINGGGTTYGSDLTFTAQAPPPSYKFSFGSAGTGNGQFFFPTGIAVDSEGSVWVADYGNNRIQKFNSKGEYLSQFGSSGSGNGQFKLPEAIDIDSEGNIWVVDSGNNRIQKFNSKGEYLSQFGSQGSGNGQLQSPYSLDVDAEGSVWVVDSGNNRIQKFNSKGEYLSQFGSYGSLPGQFKSPTGILIDAGGNVWVSDNLNNRIQKFNSKGEYLSQFGSTGSSGGQFQSPRGLALDSEGNVWVADYSNHRIQRFNPAGQYLTHVGEGSTPAAPGDVFVDSAGKIWVIDVAGKVHMWSYP